MCLRSRAAFTLVELLVAVTILNAGLLALVSASSAVVRRRANMRARAAAVRTAAFRVELLSAQGCAAASGSTPVVAGQAESWTVSSPSKGVRDIVEQVTYLASGAGRSVVLQARAEC